MKSNPITPEDLELFESAHKAAVSRSSHRWVCSKNQESGQVQVYSPSHGMMQVIVPIADTSSYEGAFIVLMRNNWERLVLAAGETVQLKTKLAEIEERLKTVTEAAGDLCGSVGNSSVLETLPNHIHDEWASLDHLLAMVRNNDVL